MNKLCYYVLRRWKERTRCRSGDVTVLLKLTRTQAAVRMRLRLRLQLLYIQYHHSPNDALTKLPFLRIHSSLRSNGWVLDVDVDVMSMSITHFVVASQRTRGEFQRGVCRVLTLSPLPKRRNVHLAAEFSRRGAPRVQNSSPSNGKAVRSELLTLRAKRLEKLPPLAEYSESSSSCDSHTVGDIPPYSALLAPLLEMGSLQVHSDPSGHTPTNYRWSPPRPSLFGP